MPVASLRKTSSSETHNKKTHTRRESHTHRLLSAVVVCIRFVLKGFSKDGRDLTDNETKAFLAAADKDGDGKIGIDGERQTDQER